MLISKFCHLHGDNIKLIPHPPSKTSQLVQRILKWASSFNTTHSCWQHSLSQLTTRPCWLTRSCQEFRRRACSLLIRQARCLLSTALCVNVAEQDHIIWTQAVHNSSLHHSTWANTPTSSSREGCTNRWGFGKNDRDMTIYQSARAESKSTSVPPSPLGTAEGHQGCTDGRQDIPPRFCVLVFGVISYSTQHRVGVGVGFYLRSAQRKEREIWISLPGHCPLPPMHSSSAAQLFKYWMLFFLIAVNV